jgi:hypothetical protein
MPKSNTVARSLHDVGLAAWFGGSLMGAVGLNAASGEAGEPKERARVADAGWARWTAPGAVAIGAHLLGSALLLKANGKRVAAQRGAPTVTVAKLALTGVALGATAYARVQGQKVMDAGDPPVLDGTTPSEDTPPDVAAAQRRLKMLQWAVPAATGALIVLSAAQGEQQRPVQVAAGMFKRVLPDALASLPSTAGDRAQDIRRQARKEAQKRARRAQRHAHDLGTRAAEVGGRAQGVVDRAQGVVVDRAQGVADRAQDVAAHLPGTVAQVSALAERLPTSLTEHLPAVSEQLPGLLAEHLPASVAGRLPASVADRLAG